MRFNWTGRPTVLLRHVNSIFFINIFVILLFFIAFLPFFMQPSGLSVVLPKVIASEPVSESGFVVTIRSDDSFFLDSRPVSLEEFKAFLSGNKRKGSRVLIKADKRAHIAALANIWDLVRQTGSREVSIATND